VSALRFKDVWLFVYAAGNYSTLPISSVSPDVKSRIEVQVTNAGGKVTYKRVNYARTAPDSQRCCTFARGLPAAFGIEISHR
jgi:hypothetical protein